MADELPTPDVTEDRDDAYALDEKTVHAIQAAVEADDAEALVRLVDHMHAADIADVLEQFGDATRQHAVTLLGSSFDGELLTEDELVMFLRIVEVTSSRDHHNVIEHLKRYRNLPRIRICNKVLYPTQAISRWIEKETTNGN